MSVWSDPAFREDVVAALRSIDKSLIRLAAAAEDSAASVNVVAELADVMKAERDERGRG